MIDFKGFQSLDERKVTLLPPSVRPQPGGLSQKILGQYSRLGWCAISDKNGGALRAGILSTAEQRNFK